MTVIVEAAGEAAADQQRGGHWACAASHTSFDIIIAQPQHPQSNPTKTIFNDSQKKVIFLFSCKYLGCCSKRVPIQLSRTVDQQMRLKYSNMFYAHFANYVNQLIYPNIYTEYRVNTKDLLHWVSSTEHLEQYFPLQTSNIRSIIALNGRLFDCPLRVSTEIPLMILTGTRDVLMRRKKRLRKLIMEQSSSCEGTSSISASIMSYSTVVVLDQPLSNLSFNMQSSSLSYYSSSAVNIYGTPNTQQNEKNEQSTLSRINPWEHLIIRDNVESKLKHLIVEFYTKPSSSETIESIKSLKPSSENPHFFDSQEHIRNLSHEKTPEGSNREIQSVVKAELKKYNIAQVMGRSSLPSSRLSKSKKKVREKAEELLRHIRTSSITE